MSFLKNFRRRSSTSSQDSDKSLTESQSSPKRTVCVNKMEVRQSNNKHVAIVLPGLLLGSREFARDLNLLRRYHVTHVLNTTTEVEDVFPTLLRYLRLPLADIPSARLCDHLADAVCFIDAARADGGRVLVHCYYGQSRSAAVVIAYLIESERLRYDDALAYLQLLRPDVRPNAGFEKQLREYERERASRRQESHDSRERTHRPKSAEECRTSLH